MNIKRITSGKQGMKKIDGYSLFISIENITDKITE
jgi:hypothetical protein